MLAIYMNSSHGNVCVCVLKSEVESGRVEEIVKWSDRKGEEIAQGDMYKLLKVLGKSVGG